MPYIYMTLRLCVHRIYDKIRTSYRPITTPIKINKAKFTPI